MPVDPPHIVCGWLEPRVWLTPLRVAHPPVQDLLPRHPRNVPIDYVVHEVAITGDASLTQIEFGSCNEGNERCGVRTNKGPDDGDVYSRGRFVEASTIDKWLYEEGIETLDVLAIDTEGHDPEVLRGADKLLRRRGVKILEFERHCACVGLRG